MKKPARKPGGPKLPRHDWPKLRARFVEGREWVTLAAMAKGLAEEAKATGEPVPAISILSKRAAAENWLEMRLEVEAKITAAAQQQIISRGAAALVEMHQKHVELGQGLLAIGARWIMEREQKAQQAMAQWMQDKAAGRPVGPPPAGAVNSFKEAAVAVRLGYVIQRYAQESLSGLKGAGPKRDGATLGGADHGGVDAGDIDNQDPGQVFSRLARLLEQNGEGEDLEEPQPGRKTDP